MIGGALAYLGRQAITILQIGLLLIGGVVLVITAPRRAAQ